MSDRSFGVDNPATVAQFRTGAGPNQYLPQSRAHRPERNHVSSGHSRWDQRHRKYRRRVSRAVQHHLQLRPALRSWRLPPIIGKSAALLTTSFQPQSPCPRAVLRWSSDLIRSPTPPPSPISEPNMALALTSPFMALRLDISTTAAKPFNSSSLTRPKFRRTQTSDSFPTSSSKVSPTAMRCPGLAGADGTGISSDGAISTPTATILSIGSLAVPIPAHGNCFSDSDGDGLPDDWELANGLDPFSGSGNDGPNGDPDGDNFTNLQEFLAGTNPHDAQSLLVCKLGWYRRRLK